MTERSLEPPFAPGDAPGDTPGKTPAATRAPRPERRSPLRAIVFWGSCLSALCVLCKIALLAQTAFDGAGAHLGSLWWPLAFFHEDLQLGLCFGLLAGLIVWGVANARRAHQMVYGAYLVLALYGAGNVPVARHLSSPLTYSFVHATGGAISDSFSSFLTFGSIAVPVSLALVAAVLPFLAARRRTRLVPPLTIRVLASLLLAAALALGPHAVARTDTRGLHRNAVRTLIATTLVRHTSAQPFPALDAPECHPDAANPRLEPEARAFLAALPRRNLVWVILESTGARFLPFAGPTTPSPVSPNPMPRLGELASQALIFDHAYASYPESIKGLFAALCGREPPARREASELGGEGVPCHPIATDLRSAGYRTGLFHSGWFAYLGMKAVVDNRGFDVLVDAREIQSPYRSSFGVDDSATVTRLLRWLDDEHLGARPEEASRPPFFAVFMPIAGHHPYRAPGDAPRPFPETDDRTAYLNDLHIADEALGQLRDGLVARGLDQHTTYLVVGDHGEAFREHPGNIAHALYVYEENVHVPLLIAAPGFDRGPFHSQVMTSAIDLAPTLRALAGLPPSDAAFFQGRSLANGPPRVARFFTEQGGRRAGLRDGRWKLVFEADEKRTALFDLEADPGEQVNVAAREPARAARYRACLGGD